MHLHHLRLTDFKNYQEANLEFPAKINCLVGLNGSGKTNLLDAIYYLSATRSFLGSSDNQLVRYGANHFSIHGSFMMADGHHQVACLVQPGHRKVFSEDSRECEKLSEHIGKYPVVCISPTDMDLVRDGSDLRRKFFDTIIAQIDADYLSWLVIYTRVLKQRNSLLVLFAERNFQDSNLLQSYDDQLISNGKLIANRRKLFINEFKPLVDAAYEFVAGSQEKAELRYSSSVSDSDYEQTLTLSRQKDLVLQRTHVGIHRDDFEFMFTHGELKRLGSQGQIKSFLVALKLAQVELLKRHKGFYPILLLDDIVDKLDNVRMVRLLQKVSSEATGQLFITDAGPERTMALFNSLQIECAIFTVDKGTIVRSA